MDIAIKSYGSNRDNDITISSDSVRFFGYPCESMGSPMIWSHSSHVVTYPTGLNALQTLDPPLLVTQALDASPPICIADDCNPVEETGCDANNGLTSSTYSVDFTSGADDDNWESVGGGDVEYSDSGAEFTITEKGDSPTLQTSWYIFFGRVEVHARAASGTGIVSCVVLLSDDYDEIDWEWLGGYPDEVQTNYFGRGISTSSGRDTVEAVDDAQNTSHNYTLNWTEESLSWYLDGTLLRTVNYADASNGDEYPQTPSRVKLGIWAGGDSDNSEGTISWAGGETDYDTGPYTMIVESVDITNFNPAESYTYSDQTGDYTSIEFDAASNTENEDSDTTTSTGSAKPSATTPASSITTTFNSTDPSAVESTAAAGSHIADSDDSGSGDSNSGSNDSGSATGTINSGSKNSDQSFGGFDGGHGRNHGNGLGKLVGKSSASDGVSGTSS
ncbi:concanavalin A-like lectin/glucanase domain-containing protein [Dactylonectria macrodidyma]|uniref:Concanavalin A-like lectin/glucanase domain-containing protein n=1 Tax=Dactylonectria macrodidyma TaxID=307937 RepID=A0A9P9JM49_9HYPO|nr:concanavalin A-like lectin/glucanase domain-containing protein [Dactylonectria macrodidyma]